MANLDSMPAAFPLDVDRAACDDMNKGTDEPTSGSRRRQMMRCRLLLLMLLAWDTPVARAGPEHDLFEKKIRPVLAEHCYPCHSQQAAKRKGGLRLDTK